MDCPICLLVAKLFVDLQGPLIVAYEDELVADESHTGVDPTISPSGNLARYGARLQCRPCAFIVTTLSDLRHKLRETTTERPQSTLCFPECLLPIVWSL
jgi:hypothetical protein